MAVIPVKFCHSYQLLLALCFLNPSITLCNLLRVTSVGKGGMCILFALFVSLLTLYSVNMTFFIYFVSQGEPSKMIGASSLLDSKQNITENFLALLQKENKAFEQKIKIPSVIFTHY